MNVQSIKVKVPALILLLVIFLFSLNGVLTFSRFTRTLTESTYEQAEARLNATVNDVEAFLQEKMAVPWILSRDRNIINFMKESEWRYYYTTPESLPEGEEEEIIAALPAELRRQAEAIPVADRETPRDPELLKKYMNIAESMKNITDGDPDLMLSYVGVEKSQEFYSHPDAWKGRRGFYIKTRPWYTDALEAGETILTAPYIDGITGKLVISAVTPVFEGGDILGATAIDLSISTIQELVSGLTLDVESFAFLTDSEGLIIAHQDEELIMNAHLDNEELFPPAFSMALKETGSRDSHIEFRHGGKNYVILTDTIRQTGWISFLIVNRDEILAPIRSQLLSFVIISLATIILLSLIIILILRNMLRPIDEAVRLSLSISEGNLMVESGREFLSRKDEFGDLTRSLDRMVSSLRSIVGNIREAAVQVNLSSDQVSDSSQQIAGGASEQAASSEEVSASMEEMNSVIMQSADNAQKTESIAAKVAEDAVSNSSSMMEAVEAMKEIVEKISIIDEIARQTNLLALNAAIEAARAGEHGKGFAVVASEIRKLAERSQTAANSIMELSSSTMKSAGNSSELLNSLVGEINKTTDLIKEISAAAAEQKLGAGQINQAILELDKVIQSNASSSEELSATAEQLSTYANGMMKEINFFSINRKTEGRSPLQIEEKKD